MTDDALIEAMARAICLTDHNYDNDWQAWLKEAKAALAVARPVIERETRERCAKIADAKGELDVTGFSDYQSGWFDACDDIAAAIRSDGDE